jgi:hypothetical protein
MPRRPRHPLCKWLDSARDVLRSARKTIDSIVLFLVYLALAAVFLYHLFTFTKSSIHAWEPGTKPTQSSQGSTRNRNVRRNHHQSNPYGSARTAITPPCGLSGPDDAAKKSMGQKPGVSIGTFKGGVDSPR